MTSRTVYLPVVILLTTQFILPYVTTCYIPHATAVSFNDSINRPIINIGFLGSFTYDGGRAKLVLGAIPIAVNEVNANPNILPHHILNWTCGDVGAPNSPIAVEEMTRMREEGVVGFIGPDHSCLAEATVASAWDIPMITYMCSDERISNRTLYPMIVRTQPTSFMVAKYLVSFLSQFDWKKITLVVSESFEFTHVEESFLNFASKKNITIIERHKLPSDYLSFHLPIIEKIIDATFQKSRIYVIMADKYALIDFARVMDDKELNIRGEYVIVSAVEEAYDKNIQFQYMRKEIDPIEKAKSRSTAFQCVFILAPKLLYSEEFEREVFNYSLQITQLEQIEDVKPRLPHQASYAYDAVHVLAKAYTDVLEEGGNINNGTEVIAKIKNQTFYNGRLGYNFFINGDGDAVGNYTILSAVTEKGVVILRPVGEFEESSQSEFPKCILEKGKIEWINGIPRDEPVCGFNGDKCEPDWKIILGCSISAVLLVTAGFFILRKYQYEHKLACLLWKIDMKDVTLLRTSSDYTLQNFRNTINPQCLEQNKFKGIFEPNRSVDSSITNPFRIGFYRGNIIHIRPVYKKTIDITRAIRKEMVQMREMRHENINPFIGACIDYPNISIMTLYCSRGSLDDVLQNEDLDLDNMFVASLVSDLIKGMIYLHDSEIISHGNLKSSKCLVDNRWVLQITDFGLHEFKSIEEHQYVDEKKKMHGQMWRAPELLRLINAPGRGTQKGDVYSFGIILYEVIGRAGPWGQSSLPAKCIVDRVTNPHLYGGQIYRPPIEELNCADYIKKCMEECWNECPEHRPDFRFINVKLREMQAGLKSNIFDNMIAIMEKYAYNLEGLVQERTNQLVEEKKKTENLLLRMLPKPVADQLKRGEPVQAESFDSVTIYFSDIVGFTALSAISTPLQVVDLLNDLYTCFDSIIENYDVYKVETIGDAYMVVSGLPIPNGNKHATEIASMALHLLEAIKTFEIKHRPKERLKLRIGIHSGSCVAGVVGLKMPRYCLFGDTVNTASRMESTGEALKIHVSEACKNILAKQGGYVIKERGMTHIKGKGEMKTFWLVGKEQPEGIREQAETHPLQDRTAAIINVGDLDLTHLIDRENEMEMVGGKMKKTSDASNHAYNSCLTLFHECRKNVLNDLRREGRHQYNGYRSAPIIEFRDSSPRNYLL